MAILTSHEIRSRIENGDIFVKPYDEKKIRQNSIDVTLGKGVCVYADVVVKADDQAVYPLVNSYRESRSLEPNELGQLDIKHKNHVLQFELDESGWLLKPGILYLMHVEEVLHAPKLVMMLDGRSSYARLGIVVHFTAGFAETGFRGQYTLEVSAMHPVRVYPRTPIAQVIFHTVEGAVEDYQDRGTYVGHDALGAQPSRSWKHFT